MNLEGEIINARILIIDDNPSNIKLMERTLTSAGYTSVLGITDSRETISMYEGYQPDLIILDVNMPHLNGYQVMEKLNEVKGNDYLPVLVLTAQHDKDTLLAALNLGAKDFLTKPFEQTEALMRIRNILEVRILHNQVRNHNSILEQKVRERTRELLDTRLEIIRRLSLAAEYRDNETGLHIVRMSKMCQLIGKEYGMDEEMSELLLQASPMHDIGKIGIPDHILLKPGKLEPDEWDTMKTHTLIGAKMLDHPTSPLMSTAKEIALWHHERWDGSGYPHGLKKEEIPLPARIAALADTFDALTSDRPYKKSWSYDKASEEILSGKARHFDPDLADVFHETLDGLISIKEEYKDTRNGGGHIPFIQRKEIPGNAKSIDP